MCISFPWLCCGAFVLPFCLQSPFLALGALLGKRACDGRDERDWKATSPAGQALQRGLGLPVGFWAHEAHRWKPGTNIRTGREASCGFSRKSVSTQREHDFERDFGPKKACKLQKSFCGKHGRRGIFGDSSLSFCLSLVLTRPHNTHEGAARLNSGSGLMARWRGQELGCPKCSNGLGTQVRELAQAFRVEAKKETTKVQPTPSAPTQPPARTLNKPTPRPLTNRCKACAKRTRYLTRRHKHRKDKEEDKRPTLQRTCRNKNCSSKAINQGARRKTPKQQCWRDILK